RGQADRGRVRRRPAGRGGRHADRGRGGRGGGGEGGGADDGVGGRVGAERALEGEVGEVEDAAVGGHHEVAVAVADEADDRLVEPGGAHGALEADVAEGEDAAVGGHQPVALVGQRRDDAFHRLVELEVAGGAPEGGAEGEDAAVAGHHPVAGTVGGDRGADDGGVEVLARHVAEVAGVAPGDDPAGAGEDPVALTRRGGRQAHGALPGRQP